MAGGRCPSWLPALSQGHVEKAGCQPVGLGSRGCGCPGAWPGGLLLLSLALAFPGVAPRPLGRCVRLTPTLAPASASGRGSQETGGQLWSRQFSSLNSSLNRLLGGSQLFKYPACLLAPKLLFISSSLLKTSCPSLLYLHESHLPCKVKFENHLTEIKAVLSMLP